MTITLEGKLNGSGSDRFDKLLRRGDMMKADESDEAERALRVLRKNDPKTARTVEYVDGLFGALIDKVNKIDSTYDAHIRIPPRLANARELSPDEALAAIARMAPDARAALLNKIRQ